MFLTRNDPDFPRGIGIYRRDAKSNDQIRPFRTRRGRHEARYDVRNVFQDIIFREAVESALSHPEKTR